MSARKKTEDEVSEKNEQEGNPFEADTSKVSPEFDLGVLVASYQEKAKEQDQRKISIVERIEKAKQNIARIQAMINNLELKSAQDSVTIWCNQIIRPIMTELQNVFPNVSVELTGPYGLAGAVTLTLFKKGTNQSARLKGLDCRSVTLVPMAEGKVGVRDLESDTGEFPVGSLGWSQGLNHKVLQVPDEVSLQFILNWLK